MRKKIIVSLSIVAVVAAVAIGGTVAFFSDTETSSGNTFTAGAIDLTIDNASYRSNPDGNMVFQEGNSWNFADLTSQLFFSFSDLKPGDIGEDTISLHVDSNDAWACMNVNITDTPENDLLEPEADDGDDTEEVGELQDQLNFVWWVDDGDNVYEEGEQIFWSGSAGELFDGSWETLADSEETIFGGESGYPLEGGETYYVAKAWCFGNIEPTFLANDSNFPPNVRGSGFSCDGSSGSNVAQTDGVVADVSFHAVQSRNNDSFLCSDLDQGSD